MSHHTFTKKMDIAEAGGGGANIFIYDGLNEVPDDITHVRVDLQSL